MLNFNVAESSDFDGGNDKLYIVRKKYLVKWSL